jgi:RimJ/RimL family protein N-acetyltransferase
MPRVAYPAVVTGRHGRYERWDSARHTDALAELCADAEVMRYLGGPMTGRAAAEVSDRIADHWEVFGFGLWAAIDLADGRVAGFTGACKAAWHPAYAEQVEVGWRLGRWAWGRGLATEGAALSLAPAFEHGGLEQVLAFVHPENSRSRAVVDRLAMRRSGTTTDPRLRHELDIFVLRSTDVAAAVRSATTGRAAPATRSA